MDLELERFLENQTEMLGNLTITDSIDVETLTDICEEYHKRKLKLLGIGVVSGSLPSLDDATKVAVRISEEAIIPTLDAKEQAIFIAGFQECIKWLNVVFGNDR